MNVSQFDYFLPPELIAQTPIEPRSASRLMLVNRTTGQISHHTFADIVDILHPGDILVANDTRVIPARLFGRKETGGKVELLLLKQVDTLRWEALVGGKRLRPGVKIEIEKDNGEESPASSPPRLLVSLNRRDQILSQNQYFLDWADLPPAPVALRLRRWLAEWALW